MNMQVADSEKIKTGCSYIGTASEAVVEVAAQIRQNASALILFFCSSAYDLDAVADALSKQFPHDRVVGCTTAGEIGPMGYLNRGLVGISFAADSFAIAVDTIDGLSEFEIGQGQALTKSLIAQLEARGVVPTSSTSFALLLIDGLCMREEPVTYALQSGLGPIPLIGGSAGDDLQFKKTWVFYGGEFRSDRAVVILMDTHIPFRPFRNQHFAPGAERVVVTAADASRRIVYEINGLPAVEEYARLINVAAEQLVPSMFATWPVVVMIDGTDYVRSIQQANADGSLSFYCAIEDGLILRVAQSTDMVTKLERFFDDARSQIGEFQAVLTFDCILRRLEAERSGLKDAMSACLKKSHAVGFNTYGEQYCGVHVNQTLTGIAFGK
ncbi:nitric oxide-sensing protein NosP [Uliginosibacterium gangwonense]|uniref:nitric oxide-sensing protein NosP n=1 Tax=Uliginosibacterium gangwonense TaxID=392736 RepID=UPI0004780521|nr:nitric oxide-sensing protein NosP [Uliginosibacterium gangwonense]